MIDDHSPHRHGANGDDDAAVQTVAVVTSPWPPAGLLSCLCSDGDDRDPRRPAGRLNQGEFKDCILWDERCMRQASNLFTVAVFFL